MSQIQIYNFEILLSNTHALGLILLLPVIGILGLLIFQKPQYFESVGMMLGILFCIPYLLLLNIIAQHVGWWVYAPSPNSFFNMPVELLIGWAVLWGAFLPYAFKTLPLIAPVICAVILDIALMPLLNGVFTLGDDWLIGEAVFICACLIPSLLIFRLTAQRKHVPIRAFIQSIIWGGCVVFLIPAIVLNAEGKDIFSFLSWPHPYAAVFLFVMVLSAALGYKALWDFAFKGQGTPIPFDPPQKLVTTGIYAYIANPLQVSTLLMLVSIAIAYQSLLMVAPIAMHILYCEIFVRWHHSIDIEERFGEDWFVYKKHVKNWFPRMRPYQNKNQTS